MDVYIIIGKESSGKSSLIRGLSGVGTTGTRIVETITGNTFSLWSRHSSLQEAEIGPSEFINEVTAANNVDAALLALWPRNSTRSHQSQGGPRAQTIYPDPSGYVQAFVQARWNIQNIATLNSPDISYLTPGLSVRNFNNPMRPPYIPFNVLVRDVRAYWNWS